MAVLNAVLAANPAILIATAIAAVVAVIIVLIRNWDSFVVFFETTIAKIQARMDQVAANIKMAWTVAINGVRIAFLTIGTTIFDKVMPAINKFLDLAGKLPFVGDKFKTFNLMSTIPGRA